MGGGQLKFLCGNSGPLSDAQVVRCKAPKVRAEPQKYRQIPIRHCPPKFLGKPNKETDLLHTGLPGLPALPPPSPVLVVSVEHAAPSKHDENLYPARISLSGNPVDLPHGSVCCMVFWIVGTFTKEKLRDSRLRTITETERCLFPNPKELLGKGHWLHIPSQVFIFSGSPAQY